MGLPNNKTPTGQQHRHFSGINDEQHRTVQIHIVAQYGSRIWANIDINQTEDDSDEYVCYNSSEDEEL